MSYGEIDEWDRAAINFHLKQANIPVPIIPQTWENEAYNRLIALMDACDLEWEGLASTTLILTQQVDSPQDNSSTTVAVKPSGTYTTTTHWGDKSVKTYKPRTLQQRISSYHQTCQNLAAYISYPNRGTYQN
jgi:hypothetical protein